MFKKFYLKKHIGASLISSLIFMLIAATVIGELFMLISWSHFSTIDSASNAKILRELDSKIELGKNWLLDDEHINKIPNNDVSPANSLSFDRTGHGNLVANETDSLYIYKLAYTIGAFTSVKLPTATSKMLEKRDHCLEKFVAPMSANTYLLRATTASTDMAKEINSNDYRVIVEAIVSRDNSVNPVKITEIMRQEIWY